MYPSPLSLGRHIVQMSPEIWVVHGERPTQCLGYKIICWVTYPIPSSKLQCPQKKCSIYKRNRNVHTHMVYIHLLCIQCVISSRSLISVVWYMHTRSLLPALNPVSYYHAASLERGTYIDLWIFMLNYFFDDF